MRWPFPWGKRARPTASSTSQSSARPYCAMLALAEGSTAGSTEGSTESSANLCGVPGCQSFGRCPVLTELHDLAGHLRRVRAQVQHELSQPSMTGRYVRLTAGRLAYADLLIQACDKLRLETELPRCFGVARELEILRVEAALARYGLTP